MIAGCNRQLRAGMDLPFGLDFGAVLALGQARGVDMDLLGQALPRVERILLDEMSSEEGA